MRSIHAFQGTCCGSDLSWVCQMCSQVACLQHDPSPGELQHICDQCWSPIDFPEVEL